MTARDASEPRECPHEDWYPEGATPHCVDCGKSVFDIIASLKAELGTEASLYDSFVEHHEAEVASLKERIKNLEMFERAWNDDIGEHGPYICWDDYVNTYSRAENTEMALTKLVTDNTKRGLTSGALSWARFVLKNQGNIC